MVGVEVGQVKPDDLYPPPPTSTAWPGELTGEPVPI